MIVQVINILALPWTYFHVDLIVYWRKYGIALLILLSCCTLYSQNSATEFWGGYINRISLSRRWSLWQDYHFVNNAFFIARYGGTYQANSGTRFTAGYAFVSTSTPLTQNLIRFEHRLWGQIVRNFFIGKTWRYGIRYRYDARFRLALDEVGQVVQDRYTFNHRHRVMQSLQYTFYRYPKGNYWHIDAINEVLYNSGRSVPDGIDQIRSYFLIGFTHPKVTFLVGYHNRAILRQTSFWRINHGMTLWVIHSINLRDDKHSTDLTMM